MNLFIDTWKSTIELLVKASKLTGLEDEKQYVKELARDQYTKLIERKPNKEKTIKEQCTKTQLEFVEYLEKVMETGELE